MSRREDYGYAVARIRAMEHLLLDAAAYQRLLDSDSLTGALKVLSETSYGKFLTAEGQERYDSALESELLSVFAQLQSFVPDRELIDIFRLPYDFHNVKVLLKSGFNVKSGGKKRWDLTTSLGSIPVDDLILHMESEEYHLLPYGLSQVIPTAAAQWDQTRDLVEVERQLDDGLFAAMLQLAQKTGFDGVIEWVRARIDSENIRNLLRLKRFGFDAARSAPFLHEGGRIAADVLLQLLPEPFDSWGRVLSFSDVGLSLLNLPDDGDFDALIVTLEKTLDDYCQVILDKARYSQNAPENVVAYLWGKEAEIKNIRTILVSKGNDADKDEIRGLLRHGY